MQDKVFKLLKQLKILEEKFSHIKTPITLSIIGCVVNGPGEAAMTDVLVLLEGKKEIICFIYQVFKKEKVLTNDMIKK